MNERAQPAKVQSNTFSDPLRN